ncbi:hypothetical protein SAMN05518863_103310 [Candidatus Pantoea symbiotica]|uniref:DUF3742 domain-containing protein n=1 Tax=Candidatus Pantoea symbiotica TaxID=1884370 RepID=A0A1I3V999_9GAMM|nr:MULTISPECIES: hypothetical protein [Pantoea]SFJ91742.1 hypothetical protein SAMN05518863_103310 [Pantoea symbiotica]SFU63709.1 hypothetical protein SAMN05518864_103310 [Pantoea sp. YR525]
MKENSYLIGMTVGKVAKSTSDFFRRVRYQMLIKAGQSKLKRYLANMLFIAIIITLMFIVSSLFYYVFGIIGSIIFLFIAIALPRGCTSFGCNEDNTYNFNDGYRDGPDGYGYYVGGYRVDK